MFSLKPDLFIIFHDLIRKILLYQSLVIHYFSSHVTTFYWVWILNYWKKKTVVLSFATCRATLKRIWVSYCSCIAPEYNDTAKNCESAEILQRQDESIQFSSVLYICILYNRNGSCYGFGNALVWWENLNSLSLGMLKNAASLFCSLQ